MCRSYRPLHNMYKRERPSNLKIRYNDRPSNRVVLSNAVQRQESNDEPELGRNYVAGPVSMAIRNYV